MHTHSAMSKSHMKLEKLCHNGLSSKYKKVERKVPFSVRTHFHSCASIASPMSPSKNPSPLTEPPKSEDCRKSVSGPVTIKKNEKQENKKEMNTMNIYIESTNKH